MARKDIGTLWDRINRFNMNANFIELYDIQNRAIEEATQAVIEDSKLIWRKPVNAFADLSTTYPNAITGYTVMTRDTGKIYRFNEGVWNEIQDIDPTAINEVDTRLSSRITSNSDEIASIKSFDMSIVNTKYVDGVNGDDLNAGDELNPFATLEKALEYIRGLSPLILNGSWEIIVKGTVVEDVRVPSMPNLRGALRIAGEIDVDGNPVTIFDGATTSRKIAIWAEAETSLHLEVRDIHFKNYTNGFNGYGVIMKKNGILRTENCIATNCDIGFAAIGSVWFNFKKLKALNCIVSGYRAQYSANGTFGPGSGGTLADGCTSIGAPQGIHVSRGANVHADYCTVEDASYAGVFADHNSRVHVLGSHFKRCDHGVRTEGGAEWTNNTSEPNNFYMGTADACRVAYAHYGNSRETRLYSISANNEFRVGYDHTNVAHTGTTTRTNIYIGSHLGTLPPYFFSDDQKRLRVKIRGKIEGAGIKYIELRSTDNQGLDNVIAGGLQTQKTGDFIVEVVLHPKTLTTQMSFTNMIIHNELPTLLHMERGINTSVERWFRLTCQLADPTATVTFYDMETFLMG